MTSLAYIDDKIVPAHEARIPITDRGFLFGDSVYEVVRTYRGRPFLLDEHLVRLEASADRLRLPLPGGRESIGKSLLRLLDAVDEGESYLRIIVTRGDGPPNIDPAKAREAPRLVILRRALEGEQPAKRGASAVVVRVRRSSKESLDPAIKSGNYLNNILALMEAKARDADEALMLNERNELTEAPTSNIFLVSKGRLITPSLDSGILPGITRAFLIDIAKDEGLDVEEGTVTLDRLQGADELFLTSTLREVQAIVKLDGHPLTDGKAGPITERLAASFKEAVKARMALHGDD